MNTGIKDFFFKQVRYEGALWDITLEFREYFHIVKVSSGSRNAKLMFDSRTRARRYYNSRKWRHLADEARR